MPRGYGGVAILWKKDIDHMIKPIDLGSERIQCVEIKESCNSNILLTSVYLPTKGVKTISQNTKKQLTNYMSSMKNTMKPIK